VTSAGQEAALASLDETAEIARRRSVNEESMALLQNLLREHRFEPAGPAVANFLFVGSEMPTGSTMRCCAAA
jgi:histidinol-phosphate/aromatic aminotransferase/cobyric acid decarboxylase-like protein